MESKSAEINTAPAGTDKQQPRHRCIGLRKHTYPRINRAKVTSDAPPWLFNDATVATGKKEGRSTVTPDSHTLAKRVSMVYDAPLLSFSASCLAATRTWSIVALHSFFNSCVRCRRSKGRDQTNTSNAVLPYVNTSAQTRVLS